MIQFDEHIFQMGWNHQLDQFSPWKMVVRRSFPFWEGLFSGAKLLVLGRGVLMCWGFGIAVASTSGKYRSVRK